MFRSLHRKLVLILVLLIVSVMAVVGTFLINSINTFYLNSFYEQKRKFYMSFLLRLLIMVLVLRDWLIIHCSGI